MNKRFLVFAMVAGVSSMVTGCGSTPATTSSADTSAEGETVKVTLVAENAPYTYEDEDGNPAGYDYEVLKKVDDLLDGYTFTYDVIDYETGLIGTKEGKYDLDAGCYFRTDSREEQYLVSSPYNYYFMNLIVNPDSTIESMEDLNGKSVAPIIATDGRYAAFEDWLKRNPDVSIEMNADTTQETYVDMVESVHNGTYDAVYLSEAQFDGVKDSLGYDMKVTDIVDGRDTVFLMTQSKTELQTAVNDAIAQLEEDGTLSTLSKEYFDQDNFEIAKELGLME